MKLRLKNKKLSLRTVARETWASSERYKTLQKLTESIKKDLKESKLNLRKKAQIDQETFFDFYGLTLLSDEYLRQNPYAEQYKNLIVNKIKDEYIKFFQHFLGGPKKFKKWVFDYGKNESIYDKSYKGHPSGINPAPVVYNLIQATDIDKIVIYIDMLNAAEHESGSYFVYAPEMKKWVSKALALVSNHSAQQLLPHMSKDVQNIVREYLRLQGESGYGQEEDWQKILEAATENQLWSMEHNKQLTTEMYEYLAQSPDEDKRRFVVMSVWTPLSVRVQIAEHDSSAQVADSLIWNWDRIPLEVQQALLKNPSKDVQDYIAERRSQGFDLPPNLPLGISKRLNLKKRSLEIGGEKFPDVIKYPIQSYYGRPAKIPPTSPGAIEKQTATNAENSIYFYILAHLQDYGIDMGRPDDRNIIQTAPDKVELNPESPIIQKLFYDGWFDYLDVIAPSYVKENIPIQETLLNYLVRYFGFVK